MITNATVDICEDIRFEQNGQMTIVGVFGKDITIAPGPFPIKQLLFLFHIEGVLGSMPDQLVAEVELPQLAARQHVIPVPPFYKEAASGRWLLRAVVGFHNEIIYAGDIIARVIIGDVSRDVGVGRIVLNAPTEAPSDPA